MKIRLISSNYDIEFQLKHKQVANNENFYKFSLLFIHSQKDIKFALPDNYEVWLFASDIVFLIELFNLCMSEVINKSNNADNFEYFNQKYFITYQNDIEIIIDSGEYYPNEKEGILNCMFFFELKVAYQEMEDSTKVGFKTQLDFNNIKKFISALNTLI